MKKYIYYPNFEPPTNEWLKFAVLYLDKFESIVPYYRQHLISEEYRRLANETDLVGLFSPEYSQGDRASIKAIIEAERFLRNSHQISSLFNRVNINRDWKNPATWDYQIYGEKYSFSWGEFCEQEKIGKLNDDGILLPKSLAFIYMTHLAKEIAFDRDGNIITDNLEYDSYTSYSRIKSTNSNIRDKFMRGIINIIVPKNLNSISFNKLIEFRNNNRELISAFNSQINIIESSISNGLTEQQFIDNYTSTFNDITKEVIKLGVDMVTIPLAFYTLIQNSAALTQEYIKEILAGLGIIGGGYFGVRKSLYDKREERLCKKYLTRLSHLS
ncbi:hypothetical protein [Spirosoma agri]|uniref:Uncharacterized protein n=1 Tax=Spirosoma agri TaxID=1987381 RepID=A0A6M0IQK4_9BACT|nr:hypothetical protein [Spirosoma agri]NEU70568.1 hypothetical protein [Spirosoma agri]